MRLLSVAKRQASCSARTATFVRRDPRRAWWQRPAVSLRPAFGGGVPYPQALKLRSPRWGPWWAAGLGDGERGQISPTSRLSCHSWVLGVRHHSCSEAQSHQLLSGGWGSSLLQSCPLVTLTCWDLDGSFCAHLGSQQTRALPPTDLGSSPTAAHLGEALLTCGPSVSLPKPWRLGPEGMARGGAELRDLSRQPSLGALAATAPSPPHHRDLSW